MITLNHYLILASALFVIGFAGVVLRRNMITLRRSLRPLERAHGVKLRVCYGKAAPGGWASICLSAVTAGGVSERRQISGVTT